MAISNKNFTLRALHCRCTSVAKKKFQQKQNKCFLFLASCIQKKAAPVHCSKNPWVKILKILKNQQLILFSILPTSDLEKSTLLSRSLSPTFQMQFQSKSQRLAKKSLIFSKNINHLSPKITKFEKFEPKTHKTL